MRVLLQSATGALNPANKHRAVAAKVAPENFEKPTSWQSGLGQTGDNARAGHRAVKIKTPSPH